MRQRVLIILNPAAGRARSGTTLPRTLAALERLGCSLVVRSAGGRGEGLDALAREAEPEFDAIVAAGGDGTVGAVVNGLPASFRHTVALGVVPLGTVNLLAREIGLPRDPERIALAIASAPVREVWPGRVGERLFMVVASCGFDADTVAIVNPVLKTRIGRLVFAPALLKTLWQGRRHGLSVALDGETGSAATVIVAKGHYYAGPFVLARSAAVTKPVLQAVLLRSGGRAAMMRYLAAGFCGALHRLRDVEIRQCTTLSISGEDAEPIEADGEIVGTVPVMITVAEHPLRLIWP